MRNELGFGLFAPANQAVRPLWFTLPVQFVTPVQSVQPVQAAKLPHKALMNRMPPALLPVP